MTDQTTKTGSITEIFGQEAVNLGGEILDFLSKKGEMEGRVCNALIAATMYMLDECYGNHNAAQKLLNSYTTILIEEQVN